MQSRDETEIKAEAITLKAYPPLLKTCFDLLKAAGAEHFALFGGSVRDADYAVRNGVTTTIKDYDLRIWLAEENYEIELKAFLERLEAIAKVKFAVEPAAVNQVHYVGVYEGVEIDVSVRPIPQAFKDKPVPVSAVAMDRVRQCDMGISAVAIDPSGQAWAMPAYLYDQTHKTLTIFSIKNPERQINYANRMMAKYPDRELRWPKSAKSLSFFYSKNNNAESKLTDNPVNIPEGQRSNLTLSYEKN